MKPTAITTFKWIKRAFIAVVCATNFLLATHASGQVRLIRDLNRSENAFDIEYDEMTSANNTMFFTNLGKELWNTDGTNPGSRRFRILDSISQLTWAGTTLYFAGKDNRGWELWRSNGPSIATTRIKDIYAGTAGCNPKQLTNIDGLLYFVAEDPKHGRELWKSDGTATGTVLVKDITAGVESSNPSQLTNIHGILYFTADDQDHGRELWKSDGTSEGTVLLKDINPGTSGSDPQTFTDLNGTAYFTAFNDKTGRELWKSNGSGSGTVLLKDIEPGSASSAIANLVTMGSALYFTADAATGMYALWKSTGTTAGTTRVIDVASSESEFFLLKALKDNLYFLAFVDGEDYLWRSDGTPGGTRQVKIMSRESFPAFINFNNSVYFFEYYWDPEIYSGFINLNRMSPQGTDVSVVWKMDYGWSGDGRKLFQSPLIAINDQLMFYGILKDRQGFKLLKMDGTSEEISAVKDTFIPTFSSNPEGFISTNGVAYLMSMGDYNYENVYRTDATAAGTFPLKRFDYVQGIEAFGQNTYFSGVTFSGKWQLWKTDGTKSGSILVKEFSSGASSPVHVNGLLYFFNSAGELWKSDGTLAGTVRIKEFNQIHDIIKSNNTCYLYITNGTGHQELWKTNGSPGGTVRVKRIQMNRSPYFANPVTVDNILYFIGNDGIHGNELWRSDGTTTGTYMVKDLRGNDINANDFYSMTGFKGNVYFSAVESGNQYALYRSNGTAQGTVKIKSIEAIVHYIPYGDQLLFFPGQHVPPVIWSTNGTAERTYAVKLLENESSFYEVNDVIVNDVAYFTTGTNCCGEEFDGQLWRTDGTECGTFNIPTGLKNVSPVFSFGNTLLIGGYASYLYGKELYGYDVADAPESPCKDTVLLISQESDSVHVVPEPINMPYPNPFTGEFSIQFAEEKFVQMKVYTSGGLPFEDVRDLHSDLEYRFGGNWPPGTYILQITTPGKTWVQRVVKRR